MEQAPIISASKKLSSNDQIDDQASKHLVHPNASVLALGILLCELHYCTPVETWRSDTTTIPNINTDYYTSLDVLKNLEADAGVDYYLATKACLQWEYFPAGGLTSFESVGVQKLFYQNVIKRLESELFKSWRLRLEDLDALSHQENELCWGAIGREVVRRDNLRPDASVPVAGAPADPLRSTSNSQSSGHISQSSAIVLPVRTPQNTAIVSRVQHISPLNRSLYLFDASYPKASEEILQLSEQWKERLMASIYHYVDCFDVAIQSSQTPINGTASIFEPVRIAILDSGFDPSNPLVLTDNQQLYPQIKDVQNFVSGMDSLDIKDEIGHGTHALGLLLKFAPCAEIYIAKIASRETLGSDSYDAIAKAIEYASNEWKVDIISMSFGIRDYHEHMKDAISNALHKRTLLFAAASNDGGNLGRAFPAKYPSVFCIHSTDGNGNPSAFNPTADAKDVNFSLLGEHVRSHWPAGVKGHHEIVNVMSGTSTATPIAAGLAASLLSFVRQQERGSSAGEELLSSWLKDVHSMDAVLKSMVRSRRGGYDYITPHFLLDRSSSRDHLYNMIKDIKKHMYD